MQILISVIITVVVVLLFLLFMWLDNEYPFLFIGIFSVLLVLLALVALFVIVYETVGALI